MVDLDDPNGYRAALEREERLLENAEDIEAADKDAIASWKRSRSGSIALGSLVTYHRRVRRVAELTDVPLVDWSQDTAERVFYELAHDESLGNDGCWSDATMQNHENAVCLFLQWNRDANWVDEIERTRVERDPVSADEMLTPDDIEALLDATRYARDRALIEFLADTGARRSLVCSLRVRDVSLDGEKATYQPNADALGLKGAEITQYPIIDARASLRTYLRTGHPRPDDPDVALFHLLKGWDADGDGACDPKPIRVHLQRIAGRAGVEKPVNPHNFRHSAITRMVREGYTKTQIEHRVHWEIDSGMWDRYVHVTSEELNDDIFAAAGVVDDEDSVDARRSRCGNCTEPLAPHHRHCPNCGVAASQPRRELVERVDERFVEMLVSTEDAQLRERIAEARRYAKQNPSEVPDIAASVLDDHE